MKPLHLAEIGLPVATASPVASVKSPKTSIAEAEWKGQGLQAAPVPNSSWQKYNSIENVTNRNFVGQVQALVASIGTDLEWVATEKVHGANFSFQTDGNSIEYASRSSKLGKGADFFNANSTMPRYHPCVLAAFELVKQTSPELQQLTIYGEYFGGYYPGYPAEAGMKKVQGGVAYSPGHHFYAFDVSIDGKRFLDFDDASAILTAAGFPLVATSICRGSLQDVLAIDVEEFHTEIPAKLGHPILDRLRVAEGVVIRPVREVSTGRVEQRCILKKKAQAFWEATNQPGMAAKVASHNATIGLEACSEDGLAALARSFLNENRLRAVISKSPDLLREGQQMKLTGLLAKDVCEDLQKSQPEEFNSLGKERGRLQKTVMLMARAFVQGNMEHIRADVG